MPETWYFDKNEKVVDWDQVLSTGRTDRDIMTYTGEPSAYRKVWGTLNRFAHSAVSATAVQRMKDAQSPNPLPPYRPSGSANVAGPTNAQLQAQVQALMGAVANTSSGELVHAIQEQQAALAQKDQQVQARIGDLTTLTSQLSQFATDYQSRVTESVQDRAAIHQQLNTLAEDIAEMPGPPDLSPYMKKSDMTAPDLTGYAMKTDIPSLSGYARTSDIPAAPDLSGYAKKSDLTAINESIGALQSKSIQQDFQVLTTTQGLTLGTNSIDIPVTWSKAFPDTNYAVLIGTSVASVSLLGKFAANIKQGSKTKTGCTLTVSGGGIVIAAGQTIEVLAFRYGT